MKIKTKNLYVWQYENDRQLFICNNINPYVVAYGDTP